MGAWRVVLAGVIGCVLAGALRAPAGEAEARRVYTSADFFRDVLACERQLIPESYRRYGDQDPKWNAAAEAALDALARELAIGNMNSRACVPPELDLKPETLKVLAKKAVDRGCEDPLVLYAMAVGLSDGDDAAAAKPWMGKAYRAALKSRYPVSRFVGLFRRTRALVSDRRLRIEAWAHQEQAVNALITETFASDAERRLAYHMVDWTVKSVPADQRDGLVDRLGKVKGADAWILNVLRGVRETDAAWLARASARTAGERTRADERFRSHLEKARDFAVAAQKAHPGCPEAATALIAISMEQQDRDGVKAWFEKAREAQADYVPAFAAEYQALLPRWGGSDEQILAIGLEAARSDRFDTDLPYQFLYAVEFVAWDSGKTDSPMALWKLPQVREPATRIVSGYARRFAGRDDAAYYLTFQAVLELAGGDAHAARECLEKAGMRPDQSVLDRLGISRVPFEDSVYLQTSPQEELIRQAVDDIGEHRMAEARALAGHALARMAPDDPARRLALRTASSVDFCEQYNRGEWASMLAGDRPGPWYSEGPFTLEKGAVISEGHGQPFTLRMTTWVDDPGYEVVMKFQLVGTETDKRALFGVGVGLDETGRNGYRLLLRPAGAGAVMTVAPQTPPVEHPWKMQPENELHVIYWCGTAMATLNGKPISIPVNPRFNTDRVPRITFVQVGSTYNKLPSPKVRITELKMRMLKQRPE